MNKHLKFNSKVQNFNLKAKCRQVGQYLVILDMIKKVDIIRLDGA